MFCGSQPIPRKVLQLSALTVETLNQSASPNPCALNSLQLQSLDLTEDSRNLEVPTACAEGEEDKGQEQSESAGPSSEMVPRQHRSPSRISC